MKVARRNESGNVIDRQPRGASLAEKVTNFYACSTEYYTEGSLDEKSVTRIGSCQGVNASMHLLRISSQQVHRGIHPPDNLKMALNFAAILNFSGG